MFERQRWGVEQIKKGSLMVLSDIGTGKTAMFLTAIKDTGVRALVFGPLNVITSTWVDEPFEWEHLYGMRVVAARGTPAQRREIIEDLSIQVVGINYESMPWFFKTYGPNQIKKLFQWLVLDESHFVKTAGTERFKKLRYRVSCFERRYCTTGTPTPESLLEFWTQAYVVHPGILGTSRERFKKLMFSPRNPMQPQRTKWDPLPGVVEAVTEKLKAISIRMERSEMYDLPPLTEVNVRIDLPAKIRKQYDKLEDELALLLEDGTAITPGTQAALKEKLLQFCDGALTDGDEIQAELHSLKEDALKEIMDRHAGEQVLIAYRHKANRRRVEAMGIPCLSGMDDARRRALINRWNAGAERYMAIHPASAGPGLNLQKAGARIVVYLGPPWGRGLYDQTNGRVYRLGQKGHVIIYRVIARNSVDEDVIRGLAEKEASQDAILSAFKARKGVA